jgi:hypothetical protein
VRVRVDVLGEVAVSGDDDTPTGRALGGRRAAVLLCEDPATSVTVGIIRWMSGSTQV